MFSPTLLREIRDRFHHVEHCPYQGRRIFFENAGGSLTLKSVVAVNAELSAIPDNQGRDNPASKEMGRIIRQGREDMRIFLGVGNGDRNDDGSGNGTVFIGESGTECLFRVIRAAVLAGAQGGGGSGGSSDQVLGSTLEHPATASAGKRWAAQAGARYTAIPHDPRSGTVGVDDYRRHLTPDTRVATVIQTSPVTGMSVDVRAIAVAIRDAAPACFIVVDGIQHAPHGAVDVAAYDIDAYAVSGYKVFSRHNYGFAWVSPRLSVAPHDQLDGTAEDFWELGTRDAAAYATFSAVVDYLDWLGGEFTESTARRARIAAAGKAIVEHEQHLVEAMLRGVGGHKGLADLPEVFVLGGCDNARREGLVSLSVRGVPSAQVVRALGNDGIRVHIRKNDYFSGNILTPLNLETCVRVSLCHYNTAEEVEYFLKAMTTIISGG